MTVPADPAQPGDKNGKDDKDLRRIGLWGATQSGKSTFLSALYIAVNRASRQDLMIYGMDNNSTDFLVNNTSMLNYSHIFPAATEKDQQLAWNVRMRIPDRQRRRFRGKGDGTVPVDLRVDLQDSPGRLFRSVPGQESGEEADQGAQPGRLSLPGEDNQPDQAGDMASYLANCHGVLLLIDPLRERRTGDAHEYFHGTLLRMAQRAMPGVPPGERLSHHVAVCVTKFDDPDVYCFARDNGYRFYHSKDEHMFPRVSDGDAERFLHELCHGYSKSDIELVSSALGKYFYPERVRYFITSAVGFYINGEGQFQDEDYQNVLEQPGGPGQEPTYKIRGAVHPINVVEPLLWLGESVAAGR
ncbi:MAG: hypothetical protein ABSB59_12890 [Streptosporangiaceae bacterium]